MARGLAILYSGQRRRRNGLHVYTANQQPVARWLYHVQVLLFYGNGNSVTQGWSSGVDTAAPMVTPPANIVVPANSPSARITLFMGLLLPGIAATPTPKSGLSRIASSRFSWWRYYNC